MSSRVIILSILSILNAVLLFKAIWGDTGILEYTKVRAQYERNEQEIMRLDAENLALSREIRLLRKDDKYMEKMIRQRLHYLYNNEIYYIFNETTDAGASNERKN